MRALPSGDRMLRLVPEAPIHALTPVLDLTVGDATRAVLHGVEGRPYCDNRDGGVEKTLEGAMSPVVACERLVHGFDADPALSIEDPAWGRRLAIGTEGCRSVMVWNPGADLAAGFADMAPDAWRDFVCLEVANCGPDD